MKSTEKVIEKVHLFDALKHEEGRVTLWGHTCFLNPIEGAVLKDKLIGEASSDEMQKKISYFTEKFQANFGVKMTGEKFGYAKTYKNKKDLLEFSSGQFELLGYGKVTWVRMDFDRGVFIVKMNSPYAEGYRNIYGFSKTPVDYWNAGGWAGCLQYVLGKEVVCIETSCIAKGNQHCEFMIKPVDQWDKDDPLVKDNHFLFKAFKMNSGTMKM
ncbi:MAG: hypothetical protein NDI94_01375 [Candidatus Woesearchaeota archaeon]|nr:hypothetical protein [Candidatus Woesearchaeota archaeon]